MLGGVADVSLAASPTTAAKASTDPWIGTAAPDFALPTLDGHIVTLSKLRGHAVLLNFWATWCAPCRLELPWLTELSRQYGPQGLEVVGLSVDHEDREVVAGFVRDRHIDYPIVLKDATVTPAYGGARYLPQSFFIDRTGTIVLRVYGLQTRSAFEEGIKQALHTR